MTMSIPPEKSKKIVNMIKSIRNRKSMKKRDFARFIGILVSVCPASPYGWAHIKKFEYYKYKALKRCFGNYDGTLKISNDLHDDFLWWTMNLASSELSTRNPLNTLSLEKLTYKLVILLALTTSPRVQTLTKVKLSNIENFEDAVDAVICE
nr:unnamed protein product [Callosobruchus chinensis]